MFIGIVFSYYILITDPIKNTKLIDKDNSTPKNINNKYSTNKVIITKQSTLSLVDRVEELGFIPSEDKDENDAA